MPLAGLGPNAPNMEDDAAGAEEKSPPPPNLPRPTAEVVAGVAPNGEGAPKPVHGRGARRQSNRDAYELERNEGRNIRSFVLDHDRIIIQNVCQHCNRFVQVRAPTKIRARTGTRPLPDGACSCADREAGRGLESGATALLHALLKNWRGFVDTASTSEGRLSGHKPC